MSNANNYQPDPGSDPETFSSQSFGNDYYNSGRSQQSLIYNPGPSSRFPGGFEPEDTVIPNFNIKWSVNVGDQIRFINDESQVYNILGVQRSRRKRK